MRSKCRLEDETGILYIGAARYHVRSEEDIRAVAAIIG
jgi:hypothetical protein